MNGPRSLHWDKPIDIVRDYDYLTGKDRGAAQTLFNLDFERKQSMLCQKVSNDFSGYECHLIFE